MKVEVLSNNIFLNGNTHYKGDIVTVTKSEVDIVKKLDKEANRDLRIKVIAEKKKTTKAKK